MSWSPQQDAALRDVSRWLKGRTHTPQVFRLFGFAGTGKTTLAKEIAADASGRVLFGAFTGKAAHVLRTKGCTGASTIHSMIYKPEEERDGDEPTFILNVDSDVRDAQLVIIDEVSMVDEALGLDLLSYGTKVLVLGDPAQLPPVKGQGFFTNSDPNVMLTEVHRQAEGSPIIRLATHVRQGGSLAIGEYGDARVIPRAQVNAQQVLAADQILVGLNKTRHSYNRRIRALRGITSPTPVKDDKLVCLRNSKEKKLFNGSLWNVHDVPRQTRKDAAAGVTALVVTPDEDGMDRRETSVRVKNEFWDGREGDLKWTDKKGTEEFTFGYALTCHKAQGSQWDSVMVFDESASFRDEAQRWMYTAITRSAKRLTVVLNGGD
jgi:exodeoxyribonuclease-5